MGKSVDFNTQERPQFSMFLDKEQDQRLEQTCEHGRLLSLGISEQDLANKDLPSRNQQKKTKNHQKPNRDFPFLINFPLGTCQTSSSTTPRKKGVSNPPCEFLNSPSCMQSAPSVSRIRQGHTLENVISSCSPKRGINSCGSQLTTNGHSLYVDPICAIPDFDPYQACQTATQHAPLRFSMRVRPFKILWTSPKSLTQQPRHA